MMLFTFGFFDRILDIIGIGTLIYWSVKIGLWAARKRQNKT